MKSRYGATFVATVDGDKAAATGALIGHCVNHGVAGSGKTMVLGYCAEYWPSPARPARPILVLRFNEPLRVKLASLREEAWTIAGHLSAGHLVG